MNTLGVIIIIVAIVGLLYGFHRGIVREAVSLIAIVLGVIACRLFSEPATAAAAKFLGVTPESPSLSQYTASIAGCIVVFVVVWLGVYLVGRVIRGAVHAVRLGIIDSALGSIYCAGKWLLILSLLLNLLYLMFPVANFWGADPPQGIIKACLSFAPRIFGIVTNAMQ